MRHPGLSLAGKVLDVLDVLLPQHWQVHQHARQVAVLSLAEGLGVEGNAHELGVAQDFADLRGWTQPGSPAG